MNTSIAADQGGQFVQEKRQLKAVANFLKQKNSLSKTPKKKQSKVTPKRSQPSLTRNFSEILHKKTVKTSQDLGRPNGSEKLEDFCR